MAQTVKNPPTVWETWVQSLGWEDPREEGMATHSRILAWRIPRTEDPDGLQPMWSRRVGRDWVTNHSPEHSCFQRKKQYLFGFGWRMFAYYFILLCVCVCVSVFVCVCVCVSVCDSFKQCKNFSQKTASAWLDSGQVWAKHLSFRYAVSYLLINSHILCVFFSFLGLGLYKPITLIFFLSFLPRAKGNY